MPARRAGVNAAHGASVTPAQCNKPSRTRTSPRWGSRASQASGTAHNHPNRRVRTRTHGGVGGGEPRGPPLSRCVPGMPVIMEVRVLCTGSRSRSASEAQGRRREAGSEGSVERWRGPTNRNRVRGASGGTSGPLTTKSSIRQGQGRIRGGRASEDDGLTPGGLRRVPSGTGRSARSGDRGAGVSRGHSRRLSRGSG
jgi:hypothetical protein